jgi:hypothetical protein
MTDIKAVKRSRGAARGWLKRAVKLIDAALFAYPVDKFALEAAMGEFDSRLATLDEAQSSYELLLEDDAVDADIEEAAEFWEKAC